MRMVWKVWSSGKNGLFGRMYPGPEVTGGKLTSEAGVATPRTSCLRLACAGVVASANTMVSTANMEILFTGISVGLGVS